MKKRLLLILTFTAAYGNVINAKQKIEHLLPLPKSINKLSADSPFALSRAVRIESAIDSARIGDFVLSHGGSVVSSSSAPLIKVVLKDAIADARLQKEAYTLRVSENEMTIGVTCATGVIRAVQTLEQLSMGYGDSPEIEPLEITDYPAFEIRGFMHDVGRGFVSIDELKKEIDLLSKFKINVFHWHLTDNQGWRIESKLYPQLTQKSYSRLEGKYYTQDEARDLEKYCIDRGVMLIPEIDMPGHSESFTRAMGYAMQTDAGVKALTAILKEMCTTVFVNSPYFHIGTDETAISYANFVPTMVSAVRSSGKKAVSWRPGASYTKDDIDMLQLWSSNGKVMSGVPNIDCRYLYANHFDTYADVVGIYKSNVYYAQTGTDDIAGSLVGFWNDRAVETEQDVVKQNGLYASVLAVAERAWKGGGKQYIEQGGTMLPSSDSDEFKEFADWENRFLFHKSTTLKDVSIPYVRQTNVRWRITDAFPNEGDVTKIFPPETEGAKESYTYNGKNYSTTRATGAGIYLRHTWGTLVPSFYSAPATNSTAYAYTYVYSPAQQTVGAQIEFQNYGRSENDLAPQSGKWDDRGSRLWVNDEEIMPPVWLNTHTSKSSEVTLKNENMSAREPVAITLKEGWNKVFIKLPVTSFSTSRVRLEKWMFTFVLVTPDGTREVDNLIYSPEKYMDDATENLSEVISRAKATRNSKIGTDVGYYSAEAATEIDRVIATIEPTLTDATVSEETRASQIETVQTAITAFEAGYAAYFIQPKESSDSQSFWYTLSTPQRESRYVTSGGANADLTGAASASSAAAYWKFTKRADGSWNIINCSDKTYVSPNSDNNTALKSVAALPSSGWSIEPAATFGQVTVSSGTAQFNQTKSGQGYKIYNWGGGSNTTDTGCQYSIVESVPTSIEELVATTQGAISFSENSLTIKDSAKKRTIQIFDYKGNEVHAALGTTSTSFSLSRLIPGVYLVEVKPDGAAPYKGKIRIF